MNILIKKMSKLGLLKLQMIVGTLLMAAAAIGLPVSIVVIDSTLLTYPITWGIVLMGMLFFALVAFLCFIHPFLVYRKTPDVLAEADGEFLYIHAKKEAKIPLADLAGATVHVDLPYLYQKEFLEDFLIYLFSEKYGDVVLDVPGYGTYRMRFVTHVQESAGALVGFIENAVNTDC